MIEVSNIFGVGLRTCAFIELCEGVAVYRGEIEEQAYNTAVLLGAPSDVHVDALLLWDVI